MKIGLLPRIIIAIILGVACGAFFPVWAVRCFVTFNSIFSHFLSFLIPLIIVGLVTPAIADIGKGAGQAGCRDFCFEFACVHISSLLCNNHTP